MARTGSAPSQDADLTRLDRLDRATPPMWGGRYTKLSQWSIKVSRCNKKRRIEVNALRGMS